MEHDEKERGGNKTIFFVLIAAVIILIVAVSVLATLLVTGNKGSKGKTESKETEIKSESAKEESIDADDHLQTRTRETEAKETKKTENSATADYDIASNLVVRITDGFGLVQSDYISLVVPYDALAEGLLEVEADDKTSISFYYSKARDSGNGGFVFSIEAYEWGDDSYRDYPHYAYGALGEDKKYIVLFPTDLQYDFSDSVQMEEYQELQKFAEKINDQYEDNPLTIIK